MKKILKNIILILLVGVLFISTLSLIILLPVKYVIKPDVMDNAISNIDIEKLVADSSTIHDAFTEMLDPIIKETEKIGIGEEVIIKIINSKEIKGLMSGVTSNLIDYTLNGKEHGLISIDKIKDLVSISIDDINNSGYYEISNQNKENILNFIT